MLVVSPSNALPTMLCLSQHTVNSHSKERRGKYVSLPNTDKSVEPVGVAIFCSHTAPGVCVDAFNGRHDLLRDAVGVQD